MRRFVLVAAAVSLCPGLASGQGSDFFCKLNDANATVVCVEMGNPAPVFTYAIPTLDVASLSALASESEANERTRQAGETCRLRTEKFREEKLETNFNGALEALRKRAENVRRESQRNLNLYKQIISVYHGLRDRYGSALQAYRDANKSCRTTPYPTRPVRT